MHSVVIFGDVRFHNIVGKLTDADHTSEDEDSSPPLMGPLIGGAIYMRGVVEGATDTLYGASPQIFGLDHGANIDPFHTPSSEVTTAASRKPVYSIEDENQAMQAEERLGNEMRTLELKIAEDRESVRRAEKELEAATASREPGNTDLDAKHRAVEDARRREQESEDALKKTSQELDAAGDNLREIEAQKIYERKRKGFIEQTISPTTLMWDLEEVRASDGTPRLRLKRRGPAARNLFPKLSDELREHLADGKFGERTESGTERKVVPDVVVLDDLAMSMRCVHVGTDAIKIKKADSEHEVGNKAFKQVCDHLRTEAPSDAGPEYHRQDYVDALAILAARLQYAADELLRQPDQEPMEPVIIASVNGAAPDVRSGDTIWNVLWKNRELARRTVVLLDAADLRRMPVSISSGFSWERTAQDTIFELTTSPALRDLLSFGNVIVRYGVTGALHLSHDARGEWSYRLYFDPEQDDAAWSRASRDGMVLGESSVYTATFVEKMTARCLQRTGTPLLADLPEVLGIALRDSVQRCQKLFLDGYGRDVAEFHALSDKKWIPDGLFKPALLADAKSPHFIPRVQVPGIRMRNWSILNQSVQFRVDRVARMIVENGADKALNRQTGDTRLVLDGVLYVLNQPDSEIRKWLENQGWNRAHEDYETLSLDIANAIRVAVDQEFATPRIGETLKGKILDRVPEKQEKSLFVPQLRTIADNMNSLPRDQQVAGAGWKALEAAIEEFLQPCLPKERSTLSEFDDKPVAAPMVRLGMGKVDDTERDERLIVIDRQETESVRVVQRLIRKHVERVRKQDSERPLSIAVFGPPGAGKSTIVNKMIDMLTDEKVRRLQFNLSRFTSVAQLDDAFKKITDASADDEIPVAFFDEFDSKFANSHLGWLKFFLGPMEDGKYAGSPVQDAILVFAGATSESFAEFNLENRSQTDEQWLEFSNAKGPDFVSRLRGYLNVSGINPGDPDDELYPIRRAILIRNILMAYQKLNNNSKARIDPDLLRALLHVPIYKHGARSVRMLLQMCMEADGSVSKSTLPPVSQLNMQVDGKAFTDLIAKGSNGHDPNASCPCQDNRRLT